MANAKKAMYKHLRSAFKADKKRIIASRKIDSERIKSGTRDYIKSFNSRGGRAFATVNTAPVKFTRRLSNRLSRIREIRNSKRNMKTQMKHFNKLGE